MKTTTTNLTARWWDNYDVLKQMPPLPGRAADGSYDRAPVVYWISANTGLSLEDALKLFSVFRQAGAMVNIHARGWVLTEVRAKQIREALRRRRLAAEDNPPR